MLIFRATHPPDLLNLCGEQFHAGVLQVYIDHDGFEGLFIDDGAHAGGLLQSLPGSRVLLEHKVL